MENVCWLCVMEEEVEWVKGRVGGVGECQE